MTEDSKEAPTFDFAGGRACLNFANTLSGTRERPSERLVAYADLVSWSVEAGILNETQASQLHERARRHPKLAAIVLRHATALREAIFRIFDAVHQGRQPPKQDLDQFNQRLRRSFSHVRITPGSDRLSYGWEEGAALDRMLWPVVESAAELLTSDEVKRVHRCGAAGECDWLFYDDTRNRSRRWCSMKDCGNRAKARRHYSRLKKSS